MKKMLLVFIFSLVLVPVFQTISASTAEPTEDSNELRLQDMLMLLLTPYIEEELTNYYSKIIKDVSPTCYALEN